MSPVIPLPDPDPSVAFLGADHPVQIVDLVAEMCPPGTPAPPRADRPNPFLQRAPSPHTANGGSPQRSEPSAKEERSGDSEPGQS
jgi:hypothetical protein